jgi:formylglycine-generating enzyme required for sulfatase activity
MVQSYRADQKPFSLREAAQITIGILEAAGAVHKAGHVFRALRPEYVLVNVRRTGPRGNNVVVDVRVIGAGLWDLVPPGALAEDEFTRGEAQYIAPELKSFNPEPTPRSDLYSAGVMFYELLVGAVPLGTFQLPRQRRPELPAQVDNVCELALANAPEDRYPAAADFVADIKRAFRPTASTESSVESGGVSPLIWLLGGLLVVLLGVVLFWGQSDKHELAEIADAKQRKDILVRHDKASADELKEIRAKHPPNMAYIPAGPFIEGKLRQEIDVKSHEETAKEVTIPGFLIDIFEYPNLANAAPKFGITHQEAAGLCTEAGKRLCSKEEFEKACKGPLNRVFGYGDTWDQDFCGNGVEDLHKSGAMSDCKSGWGVYDIAGNFREWTGSARTATRAFVKGGLPQAAERATRCAYKSDESMAFSDDTMSFRCCRSLDAPPVADKDDSSK